jgi:hypothetical protein
VMTVVLLARAMAGRRGLSIVLASRRKASPPASPSAAG